MRKSIIYSERADPVISVVLKINLGGLISSKFTEISSARPSTGMAWFEVRVYRNAAS